MSCEHVKLLRRPLPPKHTTHSRHQPAPEPTGKQSIYDTDPFLEDYVPLESPVPNPLSSPTPPITLPTIINGFSCQHRRTAPKVRLLDLLHEDPRYTRPPPLFSLNDFLRVGQSVHEFAESDQSLEELRKTVLSSCNYKKLVNLFLLELHRECQGEVTNQSLDGLPPVKRRIPQRQIICELAAAVQLETQAQAFCKRNGIPLSDLEKKSMLCASAVRQTVLATHASYPANEIMLNSVTTKYFQGSRRTCSPFQYEREGEIISPSELAVLDCLTRGGLSLSFKAHFISQIPDVTPLAQSLLHLNLSFNDLTHFPTEVCELSQLEVLKLRDNPIEEIPAEIKKLQKLKTLVISFCKLTGLPSQLYSLSCLKHLDLSYNLIRALSTDIRNLRSLRRLNVEGNQLVALPPGLLHVSLSQLRLAGNYTHPLLWRENSLNSPQKLLHTATHTLAHTHHGRPFDSLPHAAQLALNRAGVCDRCKGPMFGPGLRLICPVHGLFGLQVVPVIFYTCSPSCHRNFRNQTRSLTNLLYED